MEERGEGGEGEKMEARQQLFRRILEALNRVSDDLHPSRESSDADSFAIKALLELRKSSNPIPFSLSRNLSQLADSVQELCSSKPPRSRLISFVTRRVWSHEVSRLAAEIESELQGLIDRETVSSLTETLAAAMRSSSETSPLFDEDKLLDEMSVLQERLSRGFNINFQDLLLKSGIFAELQWVLCNPLVSKRAREKAAVTMKELVLYNKDVFVGSVLVGGSVSVLVSMGSFCSLQVLSSLIKAIKSPLVDEINSSGGILKMVGYLSSDHELEIRAMAMDCVMEMGYFGRKEAIEAMINGGLIKRLIELQRLGLVGREANVPCTKKGEEMTRYRLFEMCVARFAVQVEVGEGLRQREKRVCKQLILKRVREGCVSDAECANIVAEVLWGSSP